MTKSSEDGLLTSIREILKVPKSQTQILDDKAYVREQLIARLTALFLLATERAEKRPRRGGAAMRQKWFSISASLAQTLARLVTDLQYEKMRLDVDEARKGMVKGNVSSQRGAIFPSVHDGAGATNTQPGT